MLARSTGNGLTMTSILYCEGSIMNINNKNKQLYTGADLEHIFGITRKTLFYYDKAGLVKPIDRIGKKRTKVYGEEGYRQMKKILQYREAGLKIEEIRLLMNDQKDDKTEIFEKALIRLEKDIESRKKEIENLKILIEEYKDHVNNHR